MCKWLPNLKSITTKILTNSFPKPNNQKLLVNEKVLPTLEFSFFYHVIL